MSIRSAGIVLLMIMTSVISYPCRGATPASVPVPLNDPVYEFLERCAGRAVIPLSSITTKPLDRINIGELLGLITTDYARLDAVLQADLDYFIREFAWDIAWRSDSDEPPPRRLRSTRYSPQTALDQPHKHLSMKRNDEFSLIFDLIGQVRIDVADDKTILRRATGITFRGQFQRNLGYYFRFVDNTERGNGPYFSRKDLLEDHYGYVGPLQGGEQTYYDLTEASIHTRWKSVDISFGKENVAWGPSFTDGLLLSGWAPSFDMLRFTAQLLENVKFVYLVGYLTSSDVPSDTLYQTGAGWTRIDRTPKWFSAHRVEYYPVDGLVLAVNEAIIWGERGLDIAYLNPLNFFYSAEHNGMDQDNILMSGDFTCRLGTFGVAYGELLIDDLNISKLGSGYAGNKLALKTGVFLSRIYLPGFDTGLEYTRIQPYVYSHFYPVNRYSNWTSSLGSRMVPNSDRLRWHSSYRPRRSVEFGLTVNWNRRGDLGGDISENVPHGETREVHFFDDVRQDWVSYEISAGWEPLTGFELQVGWVENDRFTLLADRYYISLGYRY